MNEKLKIRHSVYYELGLDIFDNVKNESDFINNANKLLKTLLEDFENIYDGTNTSIKQDNNKYIEIIKGKSVIIFVGDNSKDECFLITYNISSYSIMINRLVKNITNFIPKDYNNSDDLYLFKLGNELNDLLNYCEKNAD